MTTFGTMQTRIATELRRSNLTAEIQDAIQTVIKRYNSKRFWFNEDRSVTFSTVAGQEFYSSSDNANIPNFSQIDAVTLTRTATDRYPLEPRTFAELEQWSDSSTSTGLPSSWAYYANQLRLYPIPNAVYTVRISGVKRGSTLSATADTNFWMTDGEELIRTAAKAELYRHVIRGTEQADSLEAKTQRVLGDLRAETAQRLGAGAVVATEF